MVEFVKYLIAKGIFVAALPYAAMLGEVYVNGQGQDVWCVSNQVVPRSVYSAGKPDANCDLPTCYWTKTSSTGQFLFMENSVACPDMYMTYLHFICN